MNLINLNNKEDQTPVKRNIKRLFKKQNTEKKDISGDKKRNIIGNEN